MFHYLIYEEASSYWLFCHCICFCSRTISGCQIVSILLFFFIAFFSHTVLVHVLSIWKTSVSVELQDRVKHYKQVQKDSSKKAKQLEDKLKNAKSLQEEALKNAENEMKVLKRKSEESRAQWKQREQVRH